MVEFKKTSISSIQHALHLDHLVVEGTDEEIGYQLGCLAKAHHHIDQSADADPAIIASQYDYLKQHYPQHYARMAGFAKAHGSSLTDYGKDFSFFGQVPNGIACSAVYYPPATTVTGHGYVSRNLDFPIPRNLKLPTFPFKQAYWLEMYPESCYPSMSLFCFEVFGLALEGINSEGLTVIHLADADTAIDHEDLCTNQTRRGFNEFLPIQRLLDTCATAAEAADALQRMEHYSVAIPVHLLVADRQGHSFVFEYSADGAQKVYMPGGATKPTTITNFQLNRLADAAMTKKMEARSAENGFDRYRLLEKRLEQIPYPVSEKTIRQTNAAVYVHQDGEDELERTLFHCIYDTSSCAVKLCHLPTAQGDQGYFYEFRLNRRRPLPRADGGDEK